MLRSRAFISASSALMASTYFLSVYGAGSLAGAAAVGLAMAGLDTGEALS